MLAILAAADSGLSAEKLTQVASLKVSSDPDGDGTGKDPLVVRRVCLRGANNCVFARRRRGGGW